MSSVKEFAGLSEQELDRIETLVQSLLKIQDWMLEPLSWKRTQKMIADMMRDIELHFAYRADRKRRKSFCLAQIIFLFSVIVIGCLRQSTIL